MRWITSLKNLFSKEELPSRQKTTIKLNESIDFLRKYSPAEKLNEKLSKKDEEIKTKVEKIKFLLEDLDNAAMPKNIHESPGVENKVLSNRGAYIGFVKILLKKLESRDDFEKAFEEFSDKSIKSYYTTQYLYGKELSVVGEELQNLSKLFIEKKAINEEIRNNEFTRLENNILLLQDSLRTKKIIKNEIEILEKELKRNDSLGAERRYIELKNSEEYHQAVRQREEAETLVRNLNF